MGVENEALSKVFIPFFSLKKTGSKRWLKPFPPNYYKCTAAEITVKSVRESVTFQLCCEDLNLNSFSYVVR
jgi:hypothetical protein